MANKRIKDLPTVTAPAAGDFLVIDGNTGTRGILVDDYNATAPVRSGQITALPVDNVAFTGTWDVLNNNGTAVSTSGTTTGGVQEFFNAAYKTDDKGGLGYDGILHGGQQTTAFRFTAISWSGGVVTGTTEAAHGKNPGDSITISDTTPSGYNGVYTAAAGTTGTTIKYPLVSNPGISTVVGTLLGGGGGGARIISPAVPVTIGAGSGKKLRAGSISLFSDAAIGSSSSLIINSQIMGDLRLDGWQIFNFGTGNAVELKPSTTIATGAPQIVDSRLSWTTSGSVLVNTTGNQGINASEINIVELNADQAVSATATLTIAVPGVFSVTAHGQVAGGKFTLATTGALPTGYTAGVTYRIKTVLSADTFTGTATFAGTAITTTGTQSGVHTITFKQQRSFGFGAPTPVSGANLSFNRINIKHLHDIGAGKDAFRWGDSTPPVDVNMSGNVFNLDISTANEAANGIHTWASGNLYIASIAGITTGKSVWLEPGATGNIFILPYNEASSTITDNSGVTGNAVGANVIIQAGRQTIGGQLVPTISGGGGLTVGQVAIAAADGVSLTNGGTLATIATSGSASDLSAGTTTVVRGGTGRATGTTAYSLVATGTTATGAQQTLANGATTDILVGGGASALPVWTAGNGSGAPVRTTSPALVTPTLGAATATSLTFSPTTGGIVGTITANNASAGAVGEIISSSVASGSGVSLTNNTAANVTSISLTAGDWDVVGVVGESPTGATVTQLIGWISLTSATLPSFPNSGAAFIQPVAATTIQQFAVGKLRVSIGSTTTVYLGAFASFGAGSVAGYGYIEARRVR